VSDESLVRAYRDEIESLLDVARGLLSDVELDGLRLAIKGRRAEDVELHAVLTPRVQELRDRLVAQLEDADRELPPADVARLERLIQDWLDVGL
jgi:hypothetical protein